MQKKIIVLADCDRFYVSVCRVWEPELRNKPVVVLSNNDGCVVSSCPEAKKVGAKTGVPYFEIKKEFEGMGGVACSAEYTLFGDYSARVMQYLMELSTEIEMYSVDEAFIDITQHEENFNLQKLLKDKREQILKDLGIPVSFGASTSKTLAKIATSYAKKNSSGVFVLLDRKRIGDILKIYPVQDIWNIGSASAAKLRSQNIKTAWQFTQADPKLIRKLLTIKGERTRSELCGIPCLDLEMDPKNKKEITTSRSFLRPVFELEEIVCAISDHVFRASEKLRNSGQTCQHMYIFIMSNHFKEHQEQCFLSAQIPLEQGEDSPNVLTSKALAALKKIFKWGYEFRKCGVVLTDLRPKSELQLSLFHQNHERNESLTKAIDDVNKKFGPRKLKLMSCSKDIPAPDKARKLKRYTTNINELKVVKI